MPDPKILLEAIVQEESRLASLKADEERTQMRLRELREQLAAIDADRPQRLEADAESRGTPVTAAEKVALFQSLFRGRADVFPRRWENRRTGKRGYAPACANEWVRGVCEKPRIRCGECPDQAFLPLDDAQLLGHLQGRHVLGLYPLLEDDTCWLLAVDFDGESWREDVGAFAEACRDFGMPAAIERSRSGNGAHVWFFFTAPVAAALARRMACAVLTETMSRRHQLRMDSYDRLFPNQDTLPRGGFGNLIALPLQHEARQRGNTVFVDDGLVPQDDQWTYLASLSRIQPSTVDSVAEQAARRGRILGVRGSLTEQGANAAPWTRPPSRRWRTSADPPHAVRAGPLRARSAQPPRPPPLRTAAHLPRHELSGRPGRGSRHSDTLHRARGRRAAQRDDPR